MGKKLVTMAVTMLVVGCATPPPPTQIMGNAPTRSLPRMIITGGASADERLVRAEAECQKLGSLYKATRLTFNVGTAQTADEFVPQGFHQFVCDVKPQTEVTPLQLRSIQSRIFRSSLEEVSQAIETFTKDRGGICARPGQARVLSGIQVNGFQLAENEIECRTLGMQYNSELSKIDNGVLVRSRIYVWSYSQPSVQLTDPNEYTTLFKSIADQLFIEAIQIEAAEMR